MPRDIRSFFGGAGGAAAGAGAGAAAVKKDAGAGAPASKSKSKSKSDEQHVPVVVGKKDLGLLDEDEDMPPQPSSPHSSKQTLAKRKRATVTIDDDDDDDDDEFTEPPPPAAKSPKSTPQTTTSPLKKRTSSSSSKKQTKEDEPQEVQRAKQAAQELPKLVEGKDYELLEEGATAAAHGGGGDPAAAMATSRQKPGVTAASFVGQSLCLAGINFVLTGTNVYMDREALGDVIKRHGGKVTGNVSGKTNFLVVGPREVGPRKATTATEKNIPMIDEDGLLAMLRASHDGGAAAAIAKEKRKATSTAHAPPKPAPSTAAKDKGKAPLVAPSHHKSAGAGELWTVRYKPKHIDELVGNNTHIANARLWLETWHDVHLHGKPAPKPKGSSSKMDLSKKAIMLSGPPGCGKTSTAVCLLNDLGYTYTEVNASDTRGTAQKDVKEGVNKLSTKLREMVTNRNLFARGIQGDVPHSSKSALILDEVDGMSGSAERGGVAEVIDMIKRSKIPIICICNDKYNQKLKSLRNHCIEMDYRRPTRVQMVKRLKEIAAKEGLRLEDNALDVMAEACNGDLRMVINQIQLLAQNGAGHSGDRKSVFSYDEVKGRVGKIEKDIGLSPFEATTGLFEGCKAALSRNFFRPSYDTQTIRTQTQTQTLAQTPAGSTAPSSFPASQTQASQDKAGGQFPTNLNPLLDLCFHDADLIPLLVQENYLNHFTNFVNGGGNPRMPGDIKHSLIEYNARMSTFQVKVPRKDAMARRVNIKIPLKAGEAHRLDLIAGASEWISMSDTVWNTVRGGRGGNQHWTLMPFAALAGCVAPASIFCRGGYEALNPGEPNFNRFPSFLGNLSSTNKWRRVLRAMRTTMAASAAHISATTTSTRLDYLPVLRHMLPMPVRQHDKEGAPQVVELLREYSLTPEDWESISDLTGFQTKMTWGQDPRNGIAPATKAAITRLFNSEESHGRVHGGTVFDTSALVTQKSGDGAAKKGGGGKKKRGAAAMSAGKKGAPAARARVLADEEGVNDMDVDDEDEEGIPPGIE